MAYNSAKTGVTGINQTMVLTTSEAEQIVTQTTLDMHLHAARTLLLDLQLTEI